MKTNISMEVFDDVHCDICDRDVESHNYQIQSENEDGSITIRYYGWCPKCGSEYVWDSTFKFVSGTIINYRKCGI